MLNCTSVAPTTCAHARVHHLLASHAMCLQWDDQGRHSPLSWTACSYSGRAIVGEDGIGYPLLGAIDDVPITFALCGSCDSSYIRPSCRHNLRLATKATRNCFAVTHRLVLSLQGRIVDFHPRSLVRIALSVLRCQSWPAAARRSNCRTSGPK